MERCISVSPQSFLHIDLEQPKLLKDSITCSQALRIKRICTTSKDFENHCKELRQRFHEQGFNLAIGKAH